MKVAKALIQASGTRVVRAAILFLGLSLISDCVHGEMPRPIPYIAKSFANTQHAVADGSVATNNPCLGANYCGYPGDQPTGNWYVPECQNGSCGDETWEEQDLDPSIATITFDPPVTHYAEVTTSTLSINPSAPAGTYHFLIGAKPCCSWAPATLVVLSGGATQQDKNTGKGCDRAGSAQCADPIDIGSGNLFEEFTDYQTAGPNKLSFTRYYNSRGTDSTFAIEFGLRWRSNYDRYLNIISPTSVMAERADGRVLAFTFNGTDWTSDSDIDTKLTNLGTTWTLKDRDDTAENYTGATGKARLNTIVARNGYMQTMAYNGNGQLASVTDNYGRQLIFGYQGRELKTVTTPDNQTITYTYDFYAPPRLSQITYSPDIAAAYTYTYGDFYDPYELTSILDEYGQTFEVWNYDSSGRCNLNVRGDNSQITDHKTTITYDDVTGNRTVTNAFGVQDIYKFSTLQNVPKVTEIDRQATATTVAATRLFTYDTNGYLASATDWNGNLTAYTNDTHGQPVKIVEAFGTPVTRTTNVTYDPTFIHLPKTVVTAGLTIDYGYDASGNLHTKTLKDTTTQGIPYSTNGQTRTWTYTWNNFLPASVQTPNHNTTQFIYDLSGALTTIKNALLQSTRITQHTGGGYPLKVVDPNNVTTTLTYDPRMRLKTSSIATSAGALTTQYDYYADKIQQVTLPDNSFIQNSFDLAHRITQFTDNFNNITKYTLDALGDKTFVNVTNSDGSETTRQHSATFDALGRRLKDMGGVPATQTTRFAYDSMGDVKTITDPNGNVTQQFFDALNRRNKVTDPLPGGSTSVAYDKHDRPLQVTDPNGNATRYVYDGFGDTIQKTSPDTGVTVYYYDADGNLTQKIDALTITANYTYDALDRLKTISYPASATENVAYTYDQAGHGFGIGRLTSLTDAAGSLSRSYEERGLVISEQRIHSPLTLTTGYSYDPVGRPASITYPSGAAVTYQRDDIGNVEQMPFNAAGADATAVAYNLTYQPMGKLESYDTAFGDPWDAFYDLDDRLIQSDSTYFAQSYTYDGPNNGNNNLTGITDYVITANSQSSITYDTLNRLTGSTSGTGGPGTLAWTYDKAGNRLTETANGVPTNYGYAPGTNRLASVGSRMVSTNADGSITGFSPALGNVTGLNYNNAGRLSSVTGAIGTLGSYVYDAFGHRAVKTTGGTNQSFFIYDLSGHLLEETNGAGVARADYVYLGDVPIANYSAVTKHLTMLTVNPLGTVQVGSDYTLNANWQAAYAPFGGTVSVHSGDSYGPVVQNLRFPGQYYDSESGFHYNNARDYAPMLGRYLESDPIGLSGGINPYGYGLQNPYKYTDRSGLCLEDLCIGEAIIAAELIESIGAGTSLGAVTAGDVAAEALASAAAGGGLGEAVAAGGTGAVAAKMAAVTGEGAPAAAEVGQCMSQLPSDITPLYRAITPAEAQSVQFLNAFTNPAGIEGKYFATSFEGAQSYAAQASSAFGESYSFVQTSIPSNLIVPEMTATVDSGINSLVVPTDQLSNLSPPIFIQPGK